MKLEFALRIGPRDALLCPSDPRILSRVNDVIGPGPSGHVFISYVHEDKPAVDQLEAMLQAAGVTVWRDTADLWPGQDWRIEIRRAITQGSFAFVACFSENSAGRQSSYQNEELILAVEQMRQMQPGRQWLLPVRFASCEVPDFDLGAGRLLSSLQRIDLFGDSWSTGGARLVATVVRILGQSIPPPRTEVAALGVGDQVKSLLLEPHRQIELEDLVGRTGMELRNQLQDSERFPGVMQLQTNVAGYRVLAERIRTYTSLVTPVVEILIPGCTWGLPEQHVVWTRLMQDILNPDNGTRSLVVFAQLARIPALIALYAGGIAALHRRQYGPIRALAIDAKYRQQHRPPVPLIGAAAPPVVFENVEFTANLLSLENEGPVPDRTIEEYLTGRRGRQFTPVSDWLNALTRPFFAERIVDDDEFNETFDDFEVLLGVLAMDLRETWSEGHVYPWLGSFIWRRRGASSPPEQALLSRLQEQGDSAAEVRAGLFGGSSERAVAAAGAFAEMAGAGRRQRP